MNRVPLMLAFAALVCAAAAPAAQERTVVTPTYSLRLPAAFGAVEHHPSPDTLIGDVRQVHAAKEGWSVVTMSSAHRLAHAMDTIARRERLTAMRRGMVSRGGMEISDDTTRFSNAEMVGLLMEVHVAGRGRGLIGVAATRRGPMHTVTVMATSETGKFPHALADSIFDSLQPGADHAARSVLPDDMLAWLHGTWNWAASGEPCADNPFTLALDASGDTLLMTYRQPLKTDPGRLVYGYALVGRGDGWVRGVLRDRAASEDPSTDLSTWEFIYAEADRFCWRNTGWSASGCTLPVARVQCPRPPAAAGGTIGAALPPARGRPAVPAS